MNRQINHSDNVFYKKEIIKKKVIVIVTDDEDWLRKQEFSSERGVNERVQLYRQLRETRFPSMKIIWRIPDQRLW